MAKKKKNTAPLVWGLIGSSFWILLLCYCLCFFVGMLMNPGSKEWESQSSAIIVFTAICLAITAVSLIFVFTARKKRGAAIALIVFGALTSVVLIGIFHLISGIVSLKRLKKERAAELAASGVSTEGEANALLADVPQALPFAKNGVTEAGDKNAGRAYSESLLDPDNLDPVLYRTSDGAVIYLKQEAVLPFRNRLYAAVTVIGEEFDPDTILLFECERTAGGEALAMVGRDDENYAPLAALYGALSSGEDAAYAAAAIAEAYPERKKINAKGAAAGKSAPETDGTAAEKQASVAERPKAKPGKWIVFGIMCAYYAAMLILGLLGMCSELANDLLWSTSNAAEAEAVTKVTSMILLALVPTFGCYLALKSPFKRNKIFTIVTGAVSLALTAALVAVFFFVVWAKYRALLSTTMYAASVFGMANDKIMFPVSLALGVAGILLCYAMTFLSVNPYGVRYLKAGKCESGSFGAVVKHFGIALVFGFRNTFFRILVFKEKHEDVFLLIATALFSLVLFVVAELAVILAVLVLVMFFILIVSSLYMKTSPKSFVLSDGGYERKLTYLNYSDGRERYRDDTGTDWLTEDGGATFYKE